MNKVQWLFGDLSVSVKMGPVDDSEMGLVIKTKNIPIGLDAGGTAGPGGTVGGFGISIQEATNAEAVEYWPTITLQDPNRRELIQTTTINGLQKAEKEKMEEVGIFTMGLEVARVPSWEIAEEIVKAVYDHSKNECNLCRVVIVTSTPTQMSSLQYALDNVSIII